MEAPKSICREITATYLERSGEYPQTTYAQPSGLLEQSRRCGCRLCYVACHSVGSVTDIERNKITNREAVVENSRLSFGRPTGGDDSKRDRVVSADFRRSGLVFKEGQFPDKGGNPREVFVLDRKSG
jgi:hypothetical protein